MGFGILGTGVSGLAAAQKGLDTTGHNIANANTKGFNRQTVEQTSTVGIPFGGVFLGNGTQISSISRAFNEFSFSEVIYNKSQYNFNNAMTVNASRLDNFLADTNTGITKNGTGSIRAESNIHSTNSSDSWNNTEFLTFITESINQ